LIITDIENWQIIKQEDYGKTLFIADQLHFSKFYELNFGEYLHQPFNSSDLLFKLNRILQKQYIYPIEHLRHLFTNREWTICLFLCSQSDKIVSYQSLESLSYCNNRNQLNKLIYRIRRKITDSDAKDYIRINSVRGLGYQWIHRYVSNLWIT